jgi:serine/threonine protein kinase/tetratricopeptide (TPR) repeat protein
MSMSDLAPPRVAADRNLLFGILALQMDFIRRDTLIAAMQAWVFDKRKPLGQVLLGQNALRPDAHALLEALVQKHLELHGDDAEKSLAAVSSITSVRDELKQIADPDLQASLARFSTVPNDSDDLSGRQATTIGLPTSTGLRFRVLRPHARGALGEVFVAHDEELHREVALKQIQSHHADNPVSRSRFVLEAEITGGLEHPGIVPVYGLGTYADGRPFYAMRFIRGDSLKGAIEHFHRADAGPETAERSLALRQLLRRFVDVCNAVEYAHSRGVLHRDLKPGNVMLGPYGETLVVDWGLAKAVGKPEGTIASHEPTLRPSGTGSSDPTQMGQALGTPQYMPPEQAAGQLSQLGPASDVYSLGATLYSLLTGKAPFAGAAAGEILQKVSKGDFSRPRQVKPAVPAPLEAICLKAMALRPEDRYPSPRELADEIEHWLADEPVRAYPEPLRARTRRWIGRHRTLATAAAASMVVALVALTGGLGLLTAANAREQRERERAEQAEQTAKLEEAEARTAEQKAIESAAESRAVLDFFQQKVLAAARPKGQEGGLGREVTLRQAVEAALPFVEKSFTDQPLIEAQLRMTLGTSFWYLGLAKNAAEQYQAARTLYTKYLGPDHPDTLKSMNGLANSYEALGRHVDALKLREETLALRKAKLGPDHPESLISMNGLANSYFFVGRHADALKLYEETLALEKAKLGPDHPNTLMTMIGLANSYAALGRYTDALKLHEETLALSNAKLGPDHPDTLMTMMDLAGCYAVLGRHADAVKLYE